VDAPLFLQGVLAILFISGIDICDYSVFVSERYAF
jgi:hypothetical protein